jgi:hypothetical protein
MNIVICASVCVCGGGGGQNPTEDAANAEENKQANPNIHTQHTHVSAKWHRSETRVSQSPLPCCPQPLFHTCRQQQKKGQTRGKAMTCDFHALVGFTTVCRFAVKVW